MLRWEVNRVMDWEDFLKAESSCVAAIERWICGREHERHSQRSSVASRPSDCHYQRTSKKRTKPRANY